jgi:hypothetical protein
MARYSQYEQLLLAPSASPLERYFALAFASASSRSFTDGRLY